MRAMVLRGPGQVLRLEDLPVPDPGPGQLRLKVLAVGLCRTDLHIIDGDLPFPGHPVVLGHQIVGEVVAVGQGVDAEPGAVVGVPWLGWTCETCWHCCNDQENLCDDARFTGYHLHGGLAEYCVADARYAFPIPAVFPPEQAAPLLCAGLIGWRSLRLAGQGENVGLYGFGSAAHILTQVLGWQGRSTFAFTRPGDTEGQDFARSLGAVWAGGSDVLPPEPLDAAVVFAPIGALVPAALRAVRKGCTVVCGGIHMTDLPSFPYSLLWEERVLRSVANLTRQDAREFLEVAPRVPVHTQVTTYPLEQANQALDDLRRGRIQGSAVLVP